MFNCQGEATEMTCKCEVTLLDGSEATFEVKKKDKGSVLLNDVCRFINVVEKDYFGLIFKDHVLQNHWLNTDKKIKKQVSKTDALKFQFAVKYYPTAPGTLKEEITRYQVCLQVRRDLATHLTCSLNKLSVLLSYWLQSEYEGDSQNAKIVQNCLKDFKDPPTEASSKEFIDKVLSLYGSRDGMSSAAADSQFLGAACKLPLYGVHFYKGKDSADVKVMIGISAKGVIEKREGQAPILHSWNRIKNIAYKKTNRFKVKLLRAPSNGDPRLKKTFTFDSEAQVQEIWNTAVNHHVFYRVDEKENKPTPSASASTKKTKKRKSLLRRLSSRKKKPKTEGDVQEESANIKRRPPTVTRTSSLRRSASLQSSSLSSQSTQESGGAAGVSKYSLVKDPDSKDDSSSASSELNMEDADHKNFTPKTEDIYAEVQKENKNDVVDFEREYEDEDLMDSVIGKMDGDAGGSSSLLLTETILEEDEEPPDPAFLSTKPQFSGHYNQNTTFIPIQTHLEKMIDSNSRRPMETDLDAEAVLSPQPRSMHDTNRKEFEMKFPVKEEGGIQPEKQHSIILEDIETKEEYTEVWEEIEVGPPSPRKRKDVRFRSEEEEVIPEISQADLKDSVGEEYDEEKSGTPQEGEFDFGEQDEEEQKSPLPTFDDLHENEYWDERMKLDYLTNRYDDDSGKIAEEPQETSIKQYVPQNISGSSEEGSDEDNESGDIFGQNDLLLAELQHKDGGHIPHGISEFDTNNPYIDHNVEADSVTFKLTEIEPKSSESQKIKSESGILTDVEDMNPKLYGDDIKPEDKLPLVYDENTLEAYKDQKTWVSTVGKPTDMPSYSFDKNMSVNPSMETEKKDCDSKDEEEHSVEPPPHEDESRPFDNSASFFHEYESTKQNLETMQKRFHSEDEEKHQLEVNPLSVYEKNESGHKEVESVSFEIPTINLDSIEVTSDDESASTSTESLMQDQEPVNIESEEEDDDKEHRTELNESRSEESDLEIDESSSEKGDFNLDKTTFALPQPEYNNDPLSLNYESLHGLGDDLQLSLSQKVSAEGRLPDAGASTTAATIGDDDDLALEELDEEILYEEEHPAAEKQDKDKANINESSEGKLELEDSQQSLEDSTSRSTSLSDITNNTDELLQPDILERTWAEGAKLSEDDELFQILFRTPPMRRRKRRNKSEINPHDVHKGKHEAIAFKFKIYEEPVSPRKRENLSRRPFIPSWPFEPAALLDSRNLEQLDREALQAAIDAQKELLDEGKRIEDMELLGDVEFTSPEIFNDEVRPHPYKPNIDDDQKSSDLEPILEYIIARSRSPSASPRMVGEEFIPGVPDFVQSVVPYQLGITSTEESTASSRTTSPETVVQVQIDPESMKFPKPIIKFSPREENKLLDYEYEASIENPIVLNELNANECDNEASLNTKFDEPQLTPQQTESSGRSSPQSVTENSSQSEDTSSKTKTKSSGFPRFIHSVFPLRRSSSEKKRGRSKTRRKPERKVTKQKHKKKSRSMSKDKKHPVALPSIEVTSPQIPSKSNVSDFPLLPSPPDYSTVTQQDSLTPPIPKERSKDHDNLTDERLPSYDQESLDKIILSESDDAHSEAGTATPDTVRKADDYAD